MTKTLQAKIDEAVAFIQEAGVAKVEVGLILGSGLGELGDEVEQATAIPYDNIPNFPVSTVEGHKGQLVYGTLGGKKVLAMQGRFHYYEGYSLETVTFPVRVMKALGVETVIVTNAAGGLNETFEPGELMLITDHINFTGVNPLIGPNDASMGPRFTDMSEGYDRKYQQIVRDVAKKMDLNLKEGVYMGFTGPTYETPAEIRFARVIGADAVGMSTVPEVIVARHGGMKVIGISCITNLAAGMQATLNHEEVVETTQRVKESFKGLVKNILVEI